MPSTEDSFRKLRWLLIPMRALLVSLLVALLSFAVCLLLGIGGVIVSARLRGIQPDMTLAYRHFAFPAAIVVGMAALVSAIVLEVRYYRRERLETNGSPDFSPAPAQNYSRYYPRNYPRYKK